METLSDNNLIADHTAVRVNALAFVIVLFDGNEELKFKFLFSVLTGFGTKTFLILSIKFKVKFLFLQKYNYKFL